MAISTFDFQMRPGPHSMNVSGHGAGSGASILERREVLRNASRSLPDRASALAPGEHRPIVAIAAGSRERIRAWQDRFANAGPANRRMPAAGSPKEPSWEPAHPRSDWALAGAGAFLPPAFCPPDAAEWSPGGTARAPSPVLLPATVPALRAHSSGSGSRSAGVRATAAKSPPMVDLSL